MCQLEVGNFTAEQKDGIWIYKAKDEQPLPKAKASYKDKPQYPVIYKMEQNLKDQGKKMIVNSIDQILKSILK